MLAGIEAHAKGVRAAELEHKRRNPGPEADSDDPARSCTHCADLLRELAGLYTWSGLMELLEELYPSDAFGRATGGAGPQIIALARALDEERRSHELTALDVGGQRDELRDALADLVRLKDGPRDDAYRQKKDAAWDRARTLLAGDQ